MNNVSIRIKQRLITTVDDAPKKMTFRELEREVLRTCDASRNTVKSAIKKLVEEGELTYTNLFGRTFIEKAFHRPIRLSSRIVVAPPGIAFFPEPKDIVVRIQSGATFGNGQHPSTRLAINGIEHVTENTRFLDQHHSTAMLDVGTGSGILAIAGIKLGIDCAIGIDRDPCAEYESNLNARYNALNDRLSHRFCFEKRSLDMTQGEFQMVAANLRYPTLIRICGKLASMMASKSVIVLSGFKPEETAHIHQTYARQGLTRVWQSAERGWESIVYAKSD